jgi:predicted DCC family thiol-disulfide oxidoreductase YuxK
MGDAIVLYDQDCGFCRWSLSKVLAWDRRGALRPLALQSAEARGLLGGMGEEERMSSWHLAREGEVRSGGDAFGPLFRLLSGGAPLAALAERFPRAAAGAYRFVAGRRSLWGRFVTSGAKRRADARIRSRLRGPASSLR